METASPSRTVAWNAAVRSGGEIFAKLASVVFFLAVARELGTEHFGDLMFALSFMTVMTLPSGFGTEELITREVARDPARVHELASDVMAIKLGLSVLFVALGAGIVAVLGYSPEVLAVVLVVGAAVAIENLGRTWGAVLQAYQRMVFISVALIAQRVVTAAVGLVVLARGGSLLAIAFVMLGGAVVGFAIATVTMQRYVVAVRPAIDRSRWVKLIRLGVPIGVVAVLLTALVKIDQTLISFLSEDGNREVGFYGAAFRLVEATMFIGWSFTAAMLPWFSGLEHAREKLATGLELGTKAIAAVLVPLGLTFVLFADPLIELLYGDAYGDSAVPLRFLGAMVVFVGLNDLSASLMIALERPLAFARMVGVVLLFNVALNVLLIPPYGASGAAFVAALSSFVLFLLGLVVARRMVGRVRPVRAMGAATAGGLAMSATVLLADLPFVALALVGGLAYAVVFLAFELAAFPEDLQTFRRVVRRRSAPQGAEPARA